ncbi:MAG: acetyl-CoA carboxylase biotin carboxyl carrier protein [Phycisphaerales bacterium]|nr:acetyl-CoA carboxylase biotin carboxyl carrier protein [Phycisphaerales bacterium]
MIDIRKLKELVRLMVSNDLTELDLRDSQEQVTLKRASPQPIIQTIAAPAGAIAAHGVAAPAAAAAPASGGSAAAPSPDAGLVAIESPMVGTFYAAAAPEKPPFVSVGTSVGPDTVVCLIEAMKVFNEIKAEASGTIERVLVKNGEPVEFGQKLFLIRPA